MHIRGKKGTFRGSLEAKLNFSASPKAIFGFFRVSGMTQFLKRSKSVEIVFTDPDLGYLLATDEKKWTFLRLYRRKSDFSA